jgi:hypothetical protein
MIPRSKLERLPIPVPELTGYLVDSEGQVWRAGGAKGGKDRPLRGGELGKAGRVWVGIFDRPNMIPIEAIPGAWRMILHRNHPRVSWLAPPVVYWCRCMDLPTTLPTDYLRFVMHGQDGPPPGGRAGRARPWSPEEDAAAKTGMFAPSGWFVIRTADNPSEPWLVCGPLVFASIRSRSA